MSSRQSYAFTDLMVLARSTPGWSFDASGFLVEAAANEPRHDHDPVTLAYRGVLLESQAVNEIPNPRFEGAVAGTPGTAPSSQQWATSGIGLTREIVGTGIEGGIPYVDVRWAGTPSSTGARIMHFVGQMVVAASAGESWVSSVPLRLVGGSVTNVDVQHVVLGVTGGGAQTDSTASDVTGGLGAGALRQGISTVPLAIGMGTTAFITSRCRLGFTNALAADITLRIGAPQLWKSPFAFSPSLPPIGIPGASTRAADSLVLTDIARWFNHEQGTFVVDFVPGQTTSLFGRGIFAVDDGTSNHFFDAFLVQGGLTVQMIGLINGSPNLPQTTIGTAVLLARNTLRLSYGPAGFVASLNGAAPVTVAAAVTPNLYVARLGRRRGGGSAGTELNGWIARARYYARQYTDTPAADGYTIRDR